MVDVLRWLRDPGYRRLRAFRAAGGDELLYTGPLTVDSVVVDAGAYKGAFAERIAREWGAKIHAFEPVPAFHAEAAARLAPYRAVVLPCGLSDHDAVVRLNVAGDASSAFAGAGCEHIEVRLRDVVAVFDELGLARIDLLAINIEGAEYDLLDRLLAADRLGSIDHLLVQFHPVVDDHRGRHRRICERLALTHRLEWRYPWVWESWRRTTRPLPASGSVV
jgi:FkbM family methyltransferase